MLLGVIAVLYVYTHCILFYYIVGAKSGHKANVSCRERDIRRARKTLRNISSYWVTCHQRAGEPGCKKVAGQIVIPVERGRENRFMLF